MQEPTLKDIDKLIENYIKYSSVKKYLNELPLLIVPFLKIDTETVDYQSLFDRKLEQNKKRFIAFCLLRVYSKNSELLRNISIKHNIHKFLEKTIPDIYKQINITQKN